MGGVNIVDQPSCKVVYSDIQWPHMYFLSSGYIGGLRGLVG